MNHKLFFSLLFTFHIFFINAPAQTIEEQMTKEHPTCYDVFTNAMEVLPKLYRNKFFDSLSLALQIWKHSCDNSREVQVTSLLFAMEQSTFTIDSVNNGTLDLLDVYSRSLHLRKYNSNGGTALQNSFYRFSSVWAKLLLEQKSLDENEKFICKVFTGEIPDPINEINDKKGTYPEFAELLKERAERERTGNRTNYSFLTGIWIPTGNLIVLGNHPSIGFQIGYKGAHDQVDFTLQFRVGNTPNKYSVARNGNLYESTSYLGGYIGVDYTHYLVSKLKYEFGLLAGMGYDGFDVGSELDTPNLEPISIGSFNANGGLKFNYFVNPRFYLGLQGRYNWINYPNKGGTSLNGDAFSIDFIIGGNFLKR